MPKICMKITYLKFDSELPETNKLIIVVLTLYSKSIYAMACHMMWQAIN